MYSNYHSTSAKSVEARKRSRRTVRRHQRYYSPPVTTAFWDENRNATHLSCFDWNDTGIFGEVVRVDPEERGLFFGMGITVRETAETDSTASKQYLPRRFLSNA